MSSPFRPKFVLPSASERWFSLFTFHFFLSTFSMQLIINGEARQFENVSTLADLVTALQIKGDRIAIELNRQIVSRAAWPETKLRDGDRLEIVHFVGGG